MNRDRLGYALLFQGIDDWVHLLQVASLATWRFQGGLDARTRQFTVATMYELFESGLMNAGDIETGLGFVPWELAASDAAARIEAEWDLLAKCEEPGDVCWLANTASGDLVANRLWNATKDNPSIEANFLAICTLDYATVGWAYSVVQRFGIPDPVEARQQTLALIADLLNENLIVLGDLTDRFHPWACSNADAMLKVLEGWPTSMRSQPRLRFGYIFLTPAGYERGEAIIASHLAE
jgi:hypothetical protein